MAGKLSLLHGFIPMELDRSVVSNCTTELLPLLDGLLVLLLVGLLLLVLLLLLQLFGVLAVQGWPVTSNR